MMSGNNDERKGICLSGNWIVDHVKTIDTWPAEETLANILEEAQGTGGSPTNVSIDIARFGVDIPLFGLGLVGDDADGDYVLEQCSQLGIDTSRIQKVEGVSTSYTDVMNVRGGKRTFFHQRGANALLAPEHYDLDGLDCRILSLGYLLLLDTLDSEDAEFGTQAARVLARARSAGIRTAVDVVSEHSDRFRRVVTPALPHVDYLIVNEIEAGRTLELDLRSGGKEGEEVLNREAVESAADRLFELGVHELVAIHTPEAAYAKRASGESVWAETLRLPKDFIAGAAGAGDAFFAGTLVGLHESWDLARTLDFANAAAASSLRHPTCSGGVGSVADIESLRERYGA